jgi:very-short-patch-repair endonuclease
MFRHQTSIGRYIVDFACLTIKLIIEVDGGQHNINKAADDRRTRWLESQGYTVMRFWNNEVLQNLDGVLETIWHATAPKSE